ncbi:MAG TPA: ATP-binding cassette domain-containing protein [Vicinamibacterales bacterium]
MIFRPFDPSQDPPQAERIIELKSVTKDYRALRPLRIEHLALQRGQTVALLGLDRAAAEVLVNLITATALPDAGTVEIFGAPTLDITDSAAWFRSLERFGILSARAVLIDELTVEQNLALPLSFEIDDMAPDIRTQVGNIADEVGIPAAERGRPMGTAGAATRMRVRLGKALALNPGILLGEHPNTAVPPDEITRLGRDMAAIAARRGLAMLVLTADTAFAAAVCNDVLTLNPATGELAPVSRWRSWLTRHVR